MKIKEAIEELKNANFVKEIKEIIKSHKIISFIVFILLVLLINSQIWTTIDGLVTSGTLVIVIINMYLNAKNNKQKLEKVKIFFEIDEIKEKYLLDLDIARKEVTRAEIQGILSAFQNIPSQRYLINCLSEISFLDDIYKIQNNQLDELVIELTKEEFEGGYEYQKNLIHDGFNKNKMSKYDLHQTNI